jgi:hypothetical protein
MVIYDAKNCHGTPRVLLLKPIDSWKCAAVSQQHELHYWDEAASMSLLLEQNSD